MENYQLICKDPKCLSSTEQQFNHRHMVDSCRRHIFCKAENIGSEQDEDANDPIMSPREFSEKKKLIKQDDKDNGPMSRQKLMEANSKSNFFGNDKPIPLDRKFIATDFAIDTWIAAHYG